MKITTILLLILCLSGFVIIVFDQVSNWVSGMTSTSVEIKYQMNFSFPILVFCADQPFNKLYNGSIPITKSQYDNWTYPFEVGLQGAMRYKYDPKTYMPKYKKDFLYTHYNGRCFVFEFEERIPLRTVLAFNIFTERRLTVYYLQDSGQQLILAMTGENTETQ